MSLSPIRSLVFSLLPLLPIRILVKLLVVIIVTIVTRVVATLLQWLLGDGLGAPVLLVGGLAAFGVRLGVAVCFPLPPYVAPSVTPGPSDAPTPGQLSWASRSPREKGDNRREELGS